MARHRLGPPGEDDPALDRPPRNEAEELARRARITLATLVAWYAAKGIALEVELHDWPDPQRHRSPAGDMADAADLMVARGLRVKYSSGWQDRGRPYSFNPTAGGITHHTASPTDIDSVLINGRSDLPGPLCNWALHADGTWVLIAAGYANHAGESLPGAPTNGTGYGVEQTGPTPTGATGPGAFPHNYEAGMAGWACILEVQGWSTQKIWGHKESCSPPGRKVDPFFGMDEFRAGVAGGGAPGEDLSIMDQATRDYLDHQFALLRVGDQSGGAFDTHDYSSVEGVGRKVDEVKKLVDLTRIGDRSGGEYDTHDYSSVEGVGRQVSELRVQVEEQGATLEAQDAKLDQILALLTEPTAGR